MLYRSKISIFMRTVDFGEPLLIDVSEVLELVKDSVELLDSPEGFGPVRPGADSVWIEGTVSGGLFTERGVTRIGAMVHQSRSRSALTRPSYVPTSKQYFIEPYVRDSDGLSRSAGPEVTFRISEDGRIEWIKFLVSQSALSLGVSRNPFAELCTEEDPIQTNGPEVEFSVTGSEFELSRAVALRALFSLALVNCKNVSLRERKYSVARGEGPLGGSFHELLIGTSQTSSSGKPGLEAAANRAHLARGHFKTFTPESPLMGRHIGTYWWGWQVRGDADIGTITKTYSLSGKKGNL